MKKLINVLWAIEKDLHAIASSMEANGKIVPEYSKNKMTEKQITKLYLEVGRQSEVKTILMNLIEKQLDTLKASNRLQDIKTLKYLLDAYESELVATSDRREN